MKVNGSSLGCWARYSIVVAVFTWLLVLFLITKGVFRQDSNDENVVDATYCDHLKVQIIEVLNELNALKAENAHLKRLNELKSPKIANDNVPDDFKSHPKRLRVDKPNVDSNVDGGDAGGDALPNLRTQQNAVVPGGSTPSRLYSKQHEISRRRIKNLIQEMLYYLKNYVDQNKAGSNSGDNNANEDELLKKSKDKMRRPIIEEFSEFSLRLTRRLLADMENFAERVDDAEKWHRTALQKLTERIQETIYHLQHPSDCSTAKILLCELNKGCGFGCQLHHVTYCLVMASASNRTMVLERNGREWRYSDSGWTSVFKPITSCEPPTDSVPFSSISQSDRVVSLPIVDVLSAKAEQLPLSFPKQFEDELLTHHSNPPVFFVSQFLWYLMQENEQMSTITSGAEEKIPFRKGPVVGLQIRRTDKVGTEAAFHSVDEYMAWAEMWFQVQEARDNAPLQRRVFVATDDPQAVTEIREKYKQYEVYFNDGIAQTAQLSNRYTDASLYGVITDIRMLSKCNYLVCTFSSQVCRMGYELMQVLQGDVADHFHSLDDIYYYGGQLAHNMVALEPYRTNVSGELVLEPGDQLGIAGNHWDGWSLATNRRTHKSGLFPSFMAGESWRIVDFPVFNVRRSGANL